MAKKAPRKIGRQSGKRPRKGAGKPARAPAKPRAQPRPPAPAPAPPKPDHTAAASEAYSAHRERAAKRQAKLSESGRDIGPIPPVVNPDRKAAAARSFRAFCESYFAATFALEWSADHLRVIAAIESAVLTGGLFAFAMPRGSGKTSLVETAALWSLLYGHRDFVAIIGADEEHARTMLDSVKTECEVNEDLLDDFPEAIYPIAALEKIHQRASGQLFKGKPTYIAWTAGEVQFPAIEGSKAAGGIIRVAGITGRIRGMSAKRALDRRKVRPSLVLIDDPQTDESAKSPSQVATRESVMEGAILGLAGPGTKISGLCTVTVVAPDDLADRLLDRSQHPAWQGERTKLVYAWPTAEALWSQYAELRREGQRTGRGTADADEFYRQRQEEMDAGAAVAWPARKNPDELTALQHAWNLRIDRGESAFAAEFQNEPIVRQNETGRLAKRELAARATNVPRGVVPLNCDQLTAFVDVQEKLLFWLVAAWNPAFGGSVVAYGAYPEQASAFFEAAHAKRTLAMAANGAAFEASIAAGLEAVAVELMGREWMREDGTAMRIGQMMIDANWGQSTQVIRTFARRSAFAASILPSHGRGIGASGQPISDRSKGRGDRLGLNWRVGQISAGQRSALYDTNFWKSFVAARMRLPVGDPEAISLHAGEHDLFIEHCVAEYPVRTEARGRVVDEWKWTGRDNHWLDCLVGSAVAASIAGIQPSATEAGGRSRKKVQIPKGAGGKIIVTRRVG
jgi:hypothetical protein